MISKKWKHELTTQLFGDMPGPNSAVLDFWNLLSQSRSKRTVRPMHRLSVHPFDLGRADPSTGEVMNLNLIKHLAQASGYLTPILEYI